MNWRYGELHAHYNEKFGRTAIKAYVSGRKTFRFCYKKYNVSDVIDNVREDLRNKFYKIKVIS